jgi:two-component system, response regulator YesN
LGYELVGTAKNGMEAIDIICDNFPDVIITDLKMPVLNGLELIERFSNLDADIDYIILSGYGEFEFAKQAMKLGVQNYLLKPTNKQELMNALTEIRTKRELKREKVHLQQTQILNSVRFPMEQSFLMEALEENQDFMNCYNKYEPLLAFSRNSIQVCICSFVEDTFLKDFLKDFHEILAQKKIPLLFPVISVKNSVLLIFPITSLSMQDEIRTKLEGLEYKSQTVSLATDFLHFKSTAELFETVVKKISRYSQILLIDGNGKMYEILNNLASPRKIREFGNEILTSPTLQDVNEYIRSAFSSVKQVEAAKNLAIALFLRLDAAQNEDTIDIACDFFRKLYSCSTIEAIQELLQGITIKNLLHAEHTEIKSKSTITTLKAYVKMHYNEEYLSLKWLAENYLFISVGYLSKQFVKEEGIRFSEYLNGLRMEEAKKLLLLYSFDNIKNIAKQVGFGNNPHYFSQVFKRFTGCTPREYLEQVALLNI